MVSMSLGVRVCVFLCFPCERDGGARFQHARSELAGGQAFGMDARCWDSGFQNFGAVWEAKGRGALNWRPIWGGRDRGVFNRHHHRPSLAGDLAGAWLVTWQVPGRFLGEIVSLHLQKHRECRAQRSTQRSTQKQRDAQGSTGKRREARGSTGKHGEVPRSAKPTPKQASADRAKQKHFLHQSQDMLSRRVGRSCFDDHKGIHDTVELPRTLRLSLHLLHVGLHL